MTNNPAIHRRPSGDIDIAVPHEAAEPAAGTVGAQPLDDISAHAGVGSATAVPEAA